MAGSPDTALDVGTIVRIAAAAGLDARDPRLTDEGSSTAAWRIESDDGPLVVRVARRDAEAPPRFEAQAAILERLAPLDSRVPRLLATNRSEGIDDPLGGMVPWSIETRPPGEAAAGDGDELPPEAARDLGEVLVRLHALPWEGWGRLQDRRDALAGEADDFTSAACERWEQAWPYEGRALISHPIARRASRLLADLGRLREPLLRFAGVEERVVLHSNLDARQVLVHEGRLGGLVDFGEAWISLPAWDIAAFGYYHGWDLAATLLEGYEPKRLLREMRLAEAQQLSIVVALHRLARSIRLGQSPEQQRRPVAFIEETLPLALRAVR